MQLASELFIFLLDLIQTLLQMLDLLLVVLLHFLVQILEALHRDCKISALGLLLFEFLRYASQFALGLVVKILDGV